MTFKVTNVIARFNSSSGGPPRVVSLIAQAGVEHWQSELFTSEFVESDHDMLLVSQFPGQVRFIDPRSHGLYGAISSALSRSNSLRTSLVDESQPSVVHLHGLWSPLLAAYASICHAARIPYIVAPHGMLEPWSLSIHRLRKRLALNTYQGRVLSRASAIHTTSDAEAENVRRLRLTKAPIFVVPNAVDEPRHAPDRSGQRSGSDKSVLLFLSRLHEKKGLGNLLAAWNAVRPCNWRLEIVGHGEAAYVTHLKETCTSQGIPDVQFHAHVDGDQREAMFEGASAFVLPTYSENFGNAVAEAMLRGLPVITTTGTPWSIVAEQNLGWYIDPTREALIEALRQLIVTEAGSLRDMGQRGRRYAEENLVIGAVRPRLLDMYRSVMAH